MPPPASLHHVGIGARDTESISYGPELLVLQGAVRSGEAERMMPEATAGWNLDGGNLSVGSRARPARGCSSPAGTRLQEAESAQVGRRARSTAAAPGEPRGERGRAGGAHSPPDTAIRDTQSIRSACTHSRRFMLQL